MKENAIVTIEHKRPNYLWISLCALQKVKHVDNFDVFVDIDQGGFHEQFKEVTKSFPVTLTLRHAWSGGTLSQWMRALRAVFALGYKNVVFLEGDMLLRTDALDYLNRAPKNECFTSLSAHFDPNLSQASYPPRTYVGYFPIGNWISCENFQRLNEYISAKKYVGQRLWNVYTGDENMEEHDRAFCFFTASTGSRTQSADTNYVLHFGAIGLHCQDKSLEPLIFTADRNDWLPNLLAIKKESPALLPLGFEYK